MARPSEDDLIARYFAPLAGPGGFGLRDDAALATPHPGHDLVVTKDMLVAGVHFFADDPPDAIARKALRVNLSDLAAKGAVPHGFLLGLALPADWTAEWLQRFAAGLATDATGFNCALLGGDTVAMPGPLTVSITAFGEVPAGRMVPRTGTRNGDRLYVSGTIGDGVLGLHLRWDREADRAWTRAIAPAVAEVLHARHLRPEPRLGLRAALVAHARAAMDVSDGFVGDLGKMLRLEGLTASVALEAIPLSSAARAALALADALLVPMLTGGDDYEIICAVPPERASAFEAMAAESGVIVALVGTAEAGDAPIRVIDKAGATLAIGSGSFQHFV